MMKLRKLLLSLSLLASLAGFSVSQQVWAACSYNGTMNAVLHSELPGGGSGRFTASNGSSFGNGSYWLKGDNQMYSCSVQAECSSGSASGHTCEWPLAAGASMCTIPGKTSLLASDPLCVAAPPEPTIEQQEALDAFDDAAADDNFDETARTAGSAAALAAYDEWKAAGKTHAQAKQAALSSGLAAAAENVHSRLEPLRTAKVSACPYGSRESLACSQAISAYNQQAAQIGPNPAEAYILKTHRDDGSTIEYSSTPHGWEVYELSASGNASKYLGVLDHLTFPPTQTTEPTKVAPLPSSSQVLTTKTVSPPSPIFPDPTANPVPVVTPENKRLTTFDPVTGEVTSRTTLMNDGTTVTTGSPPAGAVDLLRRTLSELACLTTLGASYGPWSDI